MTKPPVKITWASAWASMYPLGFFPKAPGTWGSLPGIPLGISLYYGAHALSDQLWVVWGLVLLALLLLNYAAYHVIDKTEKEWQSHDDQRIVIDETVGQAIPVALFAYSLPLVILCFVFFRLLDITKPGPIGWADRDLPGAWGTLLDDVFAGIGAAALVWLVVLILSLS